MIEPIAVLFDLDGVLTDTAELHYQSWQSVADALGLPFDRKVNEALRGLGRPESLRIVLGRHWDDFLPQRRAEIMEAKNRDYLARVERMSGADLLPGAATLLAELKTRGVRIAVASSSKNANAVIDRLGIRATLDAVVDGHDAPLSKPDPQVFIEAARRVGAARARCVVVEDAEVGVAAGLAAGMKVVGIGPPARVGAAHVRVAALTELEADALMRLVQRF